MVLPLPGQRIQIWAHTTEGHERDARSHGATLTDANGEFRLEMPQIVPAFGQPHGHLAYDSGEFQTVFPAPRDVERAGQDACRAFRVAACLIGADTRCDLGGFDRRPSGADHRGGLQPLSGVA